MNNPFVVSCRQSMRDLPYQGGDPTQSHSMRLDEGPQRLTLDILHHQEKRAVVGPAGIEHTDDAGVVYGRKSPDLFREPLLKPAIGSVLIEHCLDHDGARVQLFIDSQKHPAEPALAELALDAVAIL